MGATACTTADLVGNERVMMKLTLLSREYCGLCRQMSDQLRVWQTRYPFELEIVEIDDFPELEQKYNEFVPVLLWQDSEICHWHLDENALRILLEHGV